MAKIKKKQKAKTKKNIKVIRNKKPKARKQTAKKPAPKKARVKKAKAVVKKSKPAAKKAAVKKPASPPIKKGAVAVAGSPRSGRTAEQSRPIKKGFPEEMLAAALKVLDERQADQIVTVPLAGRSALADYMIIASGRAGRQVTAIADHLREAFFKLGARSVRIEGQQDANWVLVDGGDVIIHLFLPEVRKYYDLDTLWTKRRAK
ncbi:MAG: ribosome silencing factor [Bdellovibrionales bacterium]